MTDTMQLAEQHLISREDPRFKTLDTACFHAKNLYNAANYQLRQTLFHEHRRMGYGEQEKCFKQKDLLPDQQLPMKVVQQVLMGLHHDWDSFFAASAEYQHEPGKFIAQPRLPRYKDKRHGRHVLTFTGQAISKTALKQGQVVLSGLNVSVATRQRHINQVRIVPGHDHYRVEIIYTMSIMAAQLDDTLYAGLDVGLTNLAALTSNKSGFQPLLVNGSPLKAINQFYNKYRAQLQSQLPSGHYTSHRLHDLTNKRNRRVEALLHLASRYLIEVLLREGISTLVVGKNPGWKQHIPLSKQTNQNFVSIPHARFIEMLAYKAQLVGIRVILVEESYTSKCSFLDNEALSKHDAYLGKREKRGLFRAADGRTINADCNGAYNILRKAVPDAFGGSPDVPCHPRRVNPRQMEMNLQTWQHNGVAGRMA